MSGIILGISLHGSVPRGLFPYNRDAAKFAFIGGVIDVGKPVGCGEVFNGKVGCAVSRVGSTTLFCQIVERILVPPYSARSSNDWKSGRFSNLSPNSDRPVFL
jgi:hypothetical protein